jgi:hypothetical protein
VEVSQESIRGHGQEVRGGVRNLAEEEGNRNYEYMSHEDADMKYEKVS